MILYIKNMVCPRCKRAVKELLTDVGCLVLTVELGQAVVSSKSLPPLSEITTKLRTLGFDLLSTQESKLVERIKNLLIYNIYYQSCQVKFLHLKSYLELATHQNYQHLEMQFYSVYQTSIKQYWDMLRFERAKELLSYHEKAPGEIARKLDYASETALDIQFKRNLHLSIAEYVQSEDTYRLSLNKLL